MILGFTIGLSTLVYILIAVIIFRYWKNIVNAIGGLVYLLLFVILAIFMLNTFTNFNLGNKIDIGWYNRLTSEKEDYLIEKKDETFKKAEDFKKSVDNLDEDISTETPFKKTTTENKNENVNFEDESKNNSSDTSKKDNKSIKINKTDNKNKKTMRKNGTIHIKYNEVDKFIKENKYKLNEDELDLIKGLSPYVDWKYDSDRINIKSNKNGINLVVN